MKTKQEQATEYAESIRPITGLNKHDAPYITAFEHNADIEAAVLKGFEAAQTWIPVDKLEFPYGEFILIKNAYTCATIKISGQTDVRFITSNFTHWRPIEYK